MSHWPSEGIALTGSPGSPYTRKMIAVMRYRRIPYRYMHPGSTDPAVWPQARVNLLPTLYFPDANGVVQPVTDSTPIIRRLETMSPERAVIPTDPVLGLIDMLLEDYGDEWLTKPMFHYRWQYEADINRAAQVLPHWRNPLSSDEEIAALGGSFAERQIGRLIMVGSNEVTTPVIEDSYHRIIDLLHQHLTTHRFLMGSRPGASDFAFYGQLTQLVQFDPTSMALALAKSGRVFAWVSLMEDLTGLEPKQSDWSSSDSMAETLRAMLLEMGRVYTPVMLANEQAVKSGASEVVATVDGKPWRQRTFPYQAKCVQWLRDAHGQLDAGARKRFDTIIEATGLQPIFNA